MKKFAGNFVAMVALCWALGSTGCVMGRPNTKTALVIDSLVMVTGAALMSGKTERAAEDSGPPPAGYYGKPIFGVGAVAALATLVLYVVDRESEIAKEKRENKWQARPMPPLDPRTPDAMNQRAPVLLPALGR